MIKLKIIVFILFLASCLLPLASSYASSYSLAVTPPLFQVLIKPGKSITKSFKISNTGDPITIKTILVPFLPADNQGSVTMVDCKKNKISSCNSLSWFQSPNIGTTIFLKNKATAEIPLTLHVPSDAPTGDYYLSLVIQGQPARNKDLTGLSIAPQIAANILLTVSTDGITSKEGRVGVFKVLGGWKIPLNGEEITIIDSFSQVRVMLSVENTGNAVFHPKGTLTLNAPYLPEIQFPLTESNILAGATRMLNVKNQDEFFDNTQKNDTTSSPITLALPPSFYLGVNKLTARLTLSDLAGTLSPEGKPGKEPEIVSQVSFIGLPIKLSIGVILVLLVLAILNKLRKLDS